MPSSTSSSDYPLPGVVGYPVDGVAPGESTAPPAGADTTEPRRGAERIVPAVPWLQVLFGAALCFILLLSGWEVQMRRLELHAGDLDDRRDAWAGERRKVDSGPRDAVVLIGDSRMLFDTDLDAWQRLTGRRPIQLAMPATNAQPFLHDLANDEHFAGLLVIGTAEVSYFRRGDGGAADVLKYVKAETPSQRSGYQLHKALSRAFAFLDSNYTLYSVIEQRKWPERDGVPGPYGDVWKLSETFDDRQTVLWERLEHDPDLLDHARDVWKAIYPTKPNDPAVIDETIAKAKADVERIRARGGEVVWVRPPSTEPLLSRERVRNPRAQVWDRLLRDTHSFGIYFEDYPEMQGLPQPDWSHLARSATTRYTEAYVRVLQQHVDWLKRHPTPTAPASGS